MNYPKKVRPNRKLRDALGATVADVVSFDAASEELVIVARSDLAARTVNRAVAEKALTKEHHYINRIAAALTLGVVASSPSGEMRVGDVDALLRSMLGCNEKHPRQIRARLVAAGLLKQKGETSSARIAVTPLGLAKLRAHWNAIVSIASATTASVAGSTAKFSRLSIKEAVRFFAAHCQYKPEADHDFSATFPFAEFILTDLYQRDQLSVLLWAEAHDEKGVPHALVASSAKRDFMTAILAAGIEEEHAAATGDREFTVKNIDDLVLRRGYPQPDTTRPRRTWLSTHLGMIGPASSPEPAGSGRAAAVRRVFLTNLLLEFLHAQVILALNESVGR